MVSMTTNNRARLSTGHTHAHITNHIPKKKSAREIGFVYVAWKKQQRTHEVMLCRAWRTFRPQTCQPAILGAKRRGLTFINSDIWFWNVFWSILHECGIYTSPIYVDLHVCILFFIVLFLMKFMKSQRCECFAKLYILYKLCCIKNISQYWFSIKNA